MIDPDYPINIISFRSEAESASLCDTIKRLNYHARTVSTERWIEGEVFKPAILLMPTVGFSDESLPDKILKIISVSPYLTVFFDRISDFLLPILMSSQECYRWPCGQDELVLRLKRMWSIANKTTDDLEIPTSVHSGLGKWTELHLVGSSPAFLKVLTYIKDASSCIVPVLIEGETGTGKEMAARAIHYLGSQCDYPFIPVNCGAIPDNLIENELFGHEQGAYTDAKQCQSGLITQADGGTLFLDEIEALSSKGQVTLLRFIEDQKIKPLGGKVDKKVNVRIVAASNLPLSQLVERGLFRQDLLFRLNLLQLRLPPLRERVPDIQPLADFFMQKFRKQYQMPHKKLSPDTIYWMNHHQWRGNVRELENFIHRKFLLNEESGIGETKSNQQSIERRKLFDRRLNFDIDLSFNEAKQLTVNEFEQRYLTCLMAQTNGNVSQAALISQKERRALGKLLKKNNIDPTQYRTSCSKYDIS